MYVPGLFNCYHGMDKIYIHLLYVNFMMDNIYVTIVLLGVILLGMSVITRELVQHYRKKKRLPKTELRWKAALLLFGVFLVFSKILKIINLLTIQ